MGREEVTGQIAKARPSTSLFLTTVETHAALKKILVTVSGCKDSSGRNTGLCIPQAHPFLRLSCGNLLLTARQAYVTVTTRRAVRRRTCASGLSRSGALTLWHAHAG